MAQAKASDACHEVELRRSGLPHADGPELNAAGADANVVLVEDLGDWVTGS